MRKRIYFVGASGVGKTTLAAHVEKKYGFPRLPSAARTTLAEFGEKDFSAVLNDRERYAAYQHAVFKRQVKMEAEAEGHYVSDRAFDHLVYSALYGTIAWQIARSDAYREYMTGLRCHDDGPALFFLVRPTRAAFRQARKDGDRKEYLVWEDICRFDGCMKLLLESNEMSYVSIDTPHLNDRIRLVEAIIGMLPKR